MKRVASDLFAWVVQPLLVIGILAGGVFVSIQLAARPAPLSFGPLTQCSWLSTLAVPSYVKLTL